MKHMAEQLTFTERLDNISNELDTVLSESNTQLEAKGVDAVDALDDLPDAISQIQTGGGGETSWSQVRNKPFSTVGAGLNVVNDELIADEYELPIASASTLGGIKVGDNLTIDADGTLNATGGSGGGGADWTAVEGENGYIENKPFDVASSGQREIFDNTIDYSSVESSVAGYVYNGSDDIPELSPSDAGKSIIVTVNNRTIESVLEYAAFEGIEVYTASKDYDPETEHFSSNLGFILQIANGSGISQNSILCCIPDQVTEGVTCTITVSGIELSKLSASKISIGNGLKNANGSIALSDSVAALLNKWTPIYTSTDLDASDDGASMETNIVIMGDMFNFEFETHRSSITDVTFTANNVELDIGEHRVKGGINCTCYYKDDELEYSFKGGISGNRLSCTLHVIKSTVSYDSFITPMFASYNW